MEKNGERDSHSYIQGSNIISDSKGKFLGFLLLLQTAVVFLEVLGHTCHPYADVPGN